MSKKKNPEFLIKNLQRKTIIDLEKLREPLKKSSGLFQSPPSQIGVILVSNNAIKKLNRQFLRKNAITDILSFKFSQKYGEIIISTETAAENARTYGMSLEEEVLYLVVHGYLHLKNYRDYKPEEKEQMLEIQDRMFKKVLYLSGGRKK